MADANLLALCGPIGSGKSAAAQALRKRGWRLHKFAGPLKAMLRGYYRSQRLTYQEIEARIEGDLKETPDPLLGGQTPRLAMQTLGTEWGREIIAPDFWIEALRGPVEADLAQGLKVVIDDCRFPNEAALVRALGGEVVMLLRGSGPAGSHASEAFAFEPDRRIANTGTIAALADALSPPPPRPVSGSWDYWLGMAPGR